MVMKSQLKKVIGASNAVLLRRILQLFLLPVRLGNRRFCRCCGLTFRGFLPFFGKNDVRCPYCNSLPRQRFQIKLIESRIKTTENLKIIHFAPEFSLYRVLRKYNRISYTTADALVSFLPGICVKPDNIENLTTLGFDPELYDVIICNHVLEHIVDDDKAISEMYRVMKRGGFAYVTAPIRLDSPKTLQEDWINTDELRHRYYGSSDHVRLYGIDITDKFENAGFLVEVIKPGDLLEADELQRQGLDPDEPHFILRKD
jgi:SAM-dependent methyltransferase